MKCVVAIPTYNRASQVTAAVDAALAQTAPDLYVTVIDDASTDHTFDVLSNYFGLKNFCYVRLGRNMGTAAAKNIALALFSFVAISLHDSDDIPHVAKIERQREILELKTVEASACLNWAVAGRTPGQFVDVGLVLTQHTLVTTEAEYRIARSLSLVDDFFPGLQTNAGPPGDWILINSRLFRRSVFVKAGGYEESIEEDRELRNRLIMGGEVIWVVEEPLLTKYDSADSLTSGTATGYASARRQRDRADVWRRVAQWRNNGTVDIVPIDVPDVNISFISRPSAVSLAWDIPMTMQTRKTLSGALEQLAGAGAVI